MTFLHVYLRVFLQFLRSYTCMITGKTGKTVRLSIIKPVVDTFLCLTDRLTKIP